MVRIKPISGKGDEAPEFECSKYASKRLEEYDPVRNEITF